MAESKIIIACRVFYDELQQCLPSASDATIIWIDAALHADLDRLEQELKTVLAEVGTTPGEVQVFLGVGCHPNIVQLAREHGAKISPVKNCLEAFVGEKLGELEKDSTMVMTPGWVRAWPGIMATLGWDAVDVRMNLGRYNRILLLEPGINPLTDDEILSFFDLTQVPIDIEVLNLDHFRQTLAELIS